MLIAVLKEDHEVTGDDGCTGLWTAGQVIRVVAGEGDVDYVRRGLIVPLSNPEHLHVIPLSLLTFYLDTPGGRVPAAPLGLIQ